MIWVGTDQQDLQAGVKVGFQHDSARLIGLVHSDPVGLHRKAFGFSKGSCSDLCLDLGSVKVLAVQHTLVHGRKLQHFLHIELVLGGDSRLVRELVSSFGCLHRFVGTAVLLLLFKRFGWWFG